MAAEEEHEGASVKELLVEACRRNNTDLLADVLAGRSDPEISALLNDTTTVMGNHLYHEAASRGNYEVIDFLLDQPAFECDPVNRLEGDTPLHSAIRWLNAEPPAQRPFGRALVEMMLEAGSNPRLRNKGGLTPVQLVDPANKDLRDLIQQHEYAITHAGDFVNADDSSSSAAAAANGHVNGTGDPTRPPPAAEHESEDDDAEFSGSDDEERAEWERRREARRRGG